MNTLVTKLHNSVCNLIAKVFMRYECEVMVPLAVLKNLAEHSLLCHSYRYMHVLQHLYLKQDHRRMLYYSMILF